MLQFLTPLSQVGPADRLMGAKAHLSKGMDFESMLQLIVLCGFVAAFIIFIVISYLKEKKKQTGHKYPRH